MDSNDPSPITVVDFDAREVESGVCDKRIVEGGAIGRCGVCGCFVALIASCQMDSFKPIHKNSILLFVKVQSGWNQRSG
jgi:hypothetical protein